MTEPTLLVLFVSVAFVAPGRVCNSTGSNNQFQTATSPEIPERNPFGNRRCWGPGRPTFQHRRFLEPGRPTLQNQFIHYLMLLAAQPVRKLSMLGAWRPTLSISGAWAAHSPKSVRDIISCYWPRNQSGNRRCWEPGCLGCHSIDDDFGGLSGPLCKISSCYCLVNQPGNR